MLHKSVDTLGSEGESKSTLLNSDQKGLLNCKQQKLGRKEQSKERMPGRKGEAKRNS